MLEGIIKHTPRVKKIFRKAAGADGFSIELENGKIIDISGTAWNSEERRRAEGQNIFFQTEEGEVVFSEEQTRAVDSFD